MLSPCIPARFRKAAPLWRAFFRFYVASFVISCFMLHAQAPAFTGQTWTQLTPSGTQPLAREAHSAVFDAATGQMIVFGGVNSTADMGFSTASTGPLNDLWSLNTASGAWAQLTTTSGPAARSGMSAVYDAANSRMIIFGGGTGVTAPCQNDVWVLRNANRVAGSPSWTQLAPSDGPPPARIFHQAIYDPGSNRMIVFGGNNCFTEPAVFYNDVWVLTNANGLGGAPAWIQLSPSGTAPFARENFSAVYDPNSNKMIIFGGSGDDIFGVNDVWTLSNANGLGGQPVWTRLTPAGSAIPARSGHTAVYDAASNRMTVFGGGDSEGFVLSDTWVLTNANGSGGTPAWQQLSPFGTIPTARVEHTAVYDNRSNTMIVFAGEGSDGGSLSDIWKLSDASGIVSISALSPASVTAGGSNFALTVSGQGFGSGAVVNWNGVALPTTFVSATQLTATVAAGMIAAPGSVPITVTSAGSTSAPVTLSIFNPVSISSLSPASATAGAPAFSLTVNGSGFISSATVNWNGTALPTTFVSATQLTTSVAANLIATRGTASVTVISGNLISFPASFTILPGPAITSLSPASATAGGSAISLTVNGSGFVSGAVVNWNGAALPTTFVSATQLTTSVAASLLATSGPASVTVTSGGVTSVPAGFDILPGPAISSLSPASATVGGSAFTLTVNGSGFVAGAVVNWNGTALTTAFFSATQLTASVPANLIATQGRVSITVSSGGATSALATFTVAPVPVISSLSPAMVTAAGSGFTLTVNGSGFGSGAVVSWNGSALPTTVVSATQLTASVAASLIATPGSVPITVSSAGLNSAPATETIVPIPQITISGLSSVANPTDNPRLTISLNNGFPVAANALMELQFTPNAVNNADDPAIAFAGPGVNGNPRMISVPLPPGQTAGFPAVEFSVGTTAGVITLTTTLTDQQGTPIPGSQVSKQTVQIARSAPQIAGAVQAVRTPSGFQLTITGLSTPREVTAATFDFSGPSGVSLGTTELSADVGALFTTYYQSPNSNAGSAFVYTQPFTIQGASTSISAVKVTLKNSIGSSQPQAVNLP